MRPKLPIREKLKYPHVQRPDFAADMRHLNLLREYLFVTTLGSVSKIVKTSDFGLDGSSRHLPGTLSVFGGSDAPSVFPEIDHHTVKREYMYN